MNDEAGLRVVAQLLIYTGELSPDVVTARLGVEPTRDCRRGLERVNSFGRTRVDKLNAWFLSSEGRVDSASLQAHVDWVLGRIPSDPSRLRGLQAESDLRMHFRCTWWTNEDGAAFDLTPSQVTRLAALGLNCEFDVVCQKEEVGPLHVSAASNETETSWGKARAQLAALIGQPLCLTRRAMDLRIFHFGRLSVDGDRQQGEWALHIACPWRLDGPQGFVVGSEDAFYPPGEDGRDAGVAQGREPNHQDLSLSRVLDGAAADFGTVVSSTALIVEKVSMSDSFVLELKVSGGYYLTVVPSGVKTEAWRFFALDANDAHLVVVGETLEGR